MFDGTAMGACLLKSVSFSALQLVLHNRRQKKSTFIHGSRLSCISRFNALFRFFWAWRKLFQFNRITQFSQFVFQVGFPFGFRPFEQVLRTEFVVLTFVLQDMMDGLQDAVSYRYKRAFLAAPCRQFVIPCRIKCAFGAGGCPRYFRQYGF
jgi:hypothetical protein